MDELFSIPQAGNNGGVTLTVATIGTYSSSGSTLIFPGASAPTEKKYKRLGSDSIANGSRVLCAKVSGTWIILGRIY